mmetsp:Transcript_86239/g.189431  ORF Transcript_86239/g.189431 Transcript_86239/m.189431 type:complete len:263 (+) Transcript_86239:863-1651(+)
MALRGTILADRSGNSIPDFEQSSIKLTTSLASLNWLGVLSSADSFMTNTLGHMAAAFAGASFDTKFTTSRPRGARRSPEASTLSAKSSCCGSDNFLVAVLFESCAMVASSDGAPRALEATSSWPMPSTLLKFSSSSNVWSHSRAHQPIPTRSGSDSTSTASTTCWANPGASFLGQCENSAEKAFLEPFRVTKNWSQVVRTLLVASSRSRSFWEGTSGKCTDNMRSKYEMVRFTTASLSGPERARACSFWHTAWVKSSAKLVR